MLGFCEMSRVMWFPTTKENEMNIYQDHIMCQGALYT